MEQYNKLIEEDAKVEESDDDDFLTIKRYDHDLDSEEENEANVNNKLFKYYLSIK